jgi:hypothetical protein
MDLFTRLRQQHGWHHSAWNEIKLVQSSSTKAHYAVQLTANPAANTATRAAGLPLAAPFTLDSCPK